MKEIKNHGLSFKVALIGPKDAEAFLEGAKNFRELNQRMADEYTRLMVDGRWSACQPILFDEKGEMFDGQHRMWAIIQSGTTQAFTMIHGLNRGVVEVGVDCGGIRTGQQILSNLKVDRAKRVMPIMRSIIQGGDVHYVAKIHNSEVSDWHECLRDSVEFVMKCFPSNIKYLTKCPVMGAFGRAYLCYPEKREAIFLSAQKMREHEMEADDVSLRALHKYLVGNAGENIKRSELYGKSARMLQAHLNGERLDKVYEPSRDPFPVDVKNMMARMGKK